MTTTIAIVGGGASGTISAISLLRHPSAEPRRVVVIEPSTRLGAGVAYGTQSEAHLLNVRASGMSALADDPGHFLAWGQEWGIAATGAEFVPRLHYGPYLRDTLIAAAATAASDSTLEHIPASVAGIWPTIPGSDKFTLLLDDDTELAADHVVLATGNHFSAPTWLPRHPCVVADPWQPGAVEALAGASKLLVIGTGLTAVDVVLTLRDSGFRGVAHLVSSHGLFPATHREGAPRAQARPPAINAGYASARTARGLVRALRADAQRADDWRESVDSIRPVTTDLWRGLPRDEQQRALRHAARHWEVSRHRMAPQVAIALEKLRHTGRLTAEKGRVVDIEPIGTVLRVTSVHAGTPSIREVDAVISCVGPTADPNRHPLLAGLIEAGNATRHPLGMGLDVETDGRVRRPDGSAWKTFWTVGPLRKGADWESTAIPEIRRQASDLAASLLETPDHSLN